MGIPRMNFDITMRWHRQKENRIYGKVMVTHKSSDGYFASQSEIALNNVLW